MRVAALRRPKEPLSASVYIDALKPGLEAQGVDIVSFLSSQDTPDGVELLWHPGSGMSRVPRQLLRSDLPTLCTVHGLDSFSLPLLELSAGPRSFTNHLVSRRLRRLEWRRLERRRTASRAVRLIAVSQYGKKEIEQQLAIDSERISVIHHGVDTRVFRPALDGGQEEPPFLLHVSSFHPKKNYRRLLAAYSALEPATRPALRMIVPGLPTRLPIAEGVEVVRQSLKGPELARLYRAATAFVFPSLHETFGLPILEAMACGCPVVTSTETACPETAGDAALLVDPRSIGAISAALRRVADDAELRATLRQRGLDRAAEFSWGASAQLHVEAFQQALSLNSTRQTGPQIDAHA